MEELIDIDKLIREFSTEEISYFAEFKIDTGKVYKVGPAPAFDLNEKNIVLIDNEIAEQVISGSIRLTDCFVDPVTRKFEILKDKSLKQLDDLLHRVTNIKWSDVDEPDVYIVYENNSLTIELSEALGGTRKSQNDQTKKITWAENTKLNFLITDYNDPHIIHRVFEFSIKDLQKSPVVFLDIDFLNRQHSLYTKRLFENYVMEVK